MKFNEEHDKVLDKHRHHWVSLEKVGFTKNLDKTVFDELQKVYNEAIGKQFFSPWCSACVAELIRILYTVQEKENRPILPVVNPKPKKGKDLQ